MTSCRSRCLGIGLILVVIDGALVAPSVRGYDGDASQERGCSARVWG